MLSLKSEDDSLQPGWITSIMQFDVLFAFVFRGCGLVRPSSVPFLFLVMFTLLF